jgi:hypothetical protein
LLALKLRRRLIGGVKVAVSAVTCGGTLSVVLTRLRKAEQPACAA